MIKSKTISYNNLTIVIPTKNEKSGIIDVLQLLNDQVDCEIIVADSSDDQHSHVLLSYYSSNNPNITIIDGGLPAVARNNGAALVTTPYVLFLDADVYIYEKGIIESCLKTAIKGNYDLVTCKFKTDKPYRWVFRLFDIIQFLTSFNKPFAVGGFMLFKTDSFNQLGRFNEEDKIAEDYHLSSKVRPAKFKIQNHYVYTPSRRFRKKGVWYMTKLMIGCWLNRNNEGYYKQDHNYWI